MQNFSQIGEVPWPTLTQILQSMPLNFWNVYCFSNNQMRDETAKDNGQTAVGISPDLIWNNELALLQEIFNFPFIHVSLWKSYFLPQTSTSHFITSVQKPNYRIDLKVSANCENLQWYRFASWVIKFSQLQKIITTNHRQLVWPFELRVKQTQRNLHCLWLAHFFLSDVLSSCVWLTDPVFLVLIKPSLFRKMSFISTLPKWKSRKKNFSIWKW